MSKELNQLYAAYPYEVIKNFFSALNSALFFDRAKASVDGDVVLDVEDPESFDIDDDVEFCICSICGLLAACVPVRIEKWGEEHE